MISHMRSCDSMACGARRFTVGGGAGIPCGSMRSESSSASGADANLSSRPGTSRLDRAPGPVIEGTALFEQRKHVFCTVGRPDGKLPMPIQIERTAPVDGLEAIVPHGNSLRSAQRLAAELRRTDRSGRQPSGNQLSKSARSRSTRSGVSSSRLLGCPVSRSKRSAERLRLVGLTRWRNASGRRGFDPTPGWLPLG
jgi:hypothetical protein